MADPIARLVENLFAVQRFGNAINAEAQRLLTALFDALVSDLRKIDPTAPAADRWRRYRTDRFLDAVAERLAKAMPEWEQQVAQRLVQVGEQQSRHALAVIGVSIGRDPQGSIISAERLRSILTEDPFGDSARGKALLSEWAESLGLTTRNRIRDQIRLGMSNEETVSQIVRRIRGTQQGYVRQDPNTGAFVPKGTKGAVVRPRFVGGVWQATTRDAEAVVRTAVSHISNASIFDTYRAQADVLAGVSFSATLDDRTSVLCASLDGSFWPLDSGNIQVPPLHFNCRSTLVPVTDWERLGLDPPPEGERAARDLSGVDDLDRKVSARRRTGDLGKQTTVPSSVRYEQWLRDQPTRVQDKVLGRSRAEMFRAGKVGLRDLVRGDGTVIPIAELLR